VAAARERGVVLPVKISVVSRYQRSWRNWFRKEHTALFDDWANGIAWHWANVKGQPCDRHEIYLPDDLPDVRAMLRVLLHEIEHCIQAESFERMVDWVDEYHVYEHEYETAAIAAEDEWPEYGYLIERKA
jgi:hypothetical protein